MQIQSLSPRVRLVSNAVTEQNFVYLTFRDHLKQISRFTTLFKDVLYIEKLFNNVRKL